MQVLVNIIRNAKEALSEVSNQEKIIKLKTEVIKDKLIIKISDKGVGIRAKNLKQYLISALPQKKTGHGFGLHSSALSVDAMGGKIRVDPDPVKKWTTFTVELPYKRKK